ncbi:hypothetical protein HDU83_009438 [Entophlyctis luteolus]|nr:hypothetical protein HDU83_009438 [Entophlyctis luteolus]
MKITVLFAGAVALVQSANSLVLPYQYCTSSGCTTKKTNIVADVSGSLSGVSTSGNSLTMGPNRVYLANPAGTAYEPFYLKNRKLTFTVNLAKVPCGNNAAMYFTGMPLTATPGSSYCDSQNTCNEMDALEANIGAQAFTPHPCVHADQSNTGTDCSHWGYGINTESSTSIGPGVTSGIDVTKAFTVVTTFTTDSGTDSGTLNGVTQKFVQGSKTVTVGTVTEADFATLKSQNQYGGGMAAMSKGLDAGMVFILSLWGTANSGDMNWLDSSSTNSKCSSLKSATSATATFSNFILAPI